MEHFLVSEHASPVCSAAAAGVGSVVWVVLGSMVKAEGMVAVAWMEMINTVETMDDAVERMGFPKMDHCAVGEGTSAALSNPDPTVLIQPDLSRHDAESCWKLPPDHS